MPVRKHDPAFMNDFMFVCKANIHRSATAEHVARTMGLRADSAGWLDIIAVRNLTVDQLDHARRIVCFESNMVPHIKALVPHRHVECWEIPDNYKYCQPELVSLITCRLTTQH